MELIGTIWIAYLTAPAGLWVCWGTGSAWRWLQQNMVWVAVCAMDAHVHVHARGPLAPTPVHPRPTPYVARIQRPPPHTSSPTCFRSSLAPSTSCRLGHCGCGCTRHEGGPMNATWRRVRVHRVRPSATCAYIDFICSHPGARACAEQASSQSWVQWTIIACLPSSSVWSRPLILELESPPK